MARHVRRLVAAAALIAPIVVTVAPAQAVKPVTAVSLSGPSSGPYGSTVRMSGRLWRYGTSHGIRNQTVLLQRSAHAGNTWTTVQRTRTNANGWYAVGVTQTGAYDYRVHYPGTATFGAAMSNKHHPSTTHKVLLDALRTTNAGTGALRATGRVYPAVPKGGPVYLQRLMPDRSWRTVALGRSTGSANVVVDAKVGASVLTWRLSVPLRYPYLAGASAGKGFAHYLWRGAFNRPVGAVLLNGTFQVWSRDQAPALDKVSQHLGAGGSEVKLIVDTVGCTRITAGVAANPDSPSGASTDFGDGRSTAVPRNGAARISAEVRNRRSVPFVVITSGISPRAELTSSVWTLCARPTGA